MNLPIPSAHASAGDAVADPDARAISPQSAACLVGERAGFRWFHVEDVEGPALDALAADLGLHELAIEGCRHRGQRAKLEEYDGHLFLVFHTSHYDRTQHRCWFGELRMFVGPDFLVSVHDGPSKTAAAVRARWSSNPELASPGKVLLALLDHAVDQYTPTLDRMGRELEAIEERVLRRPDAERMGDILRMRRALIDFRRGAIASRDVISHLIWCSAASLLPLAPYLRNIYDHVVRVLDSCETQREIATGVLEVFLTAVANRTNDIVKVLTVFTTLAIPVLVVTGIYGMNVRLPFADDPNAIHVLGAGTTAIVVLFLVLLRRRGWI